jgi:hypothetical protein
MDYHIAKETEDIRDAFLIAEFEYIEKLVKIPGFSLYYSKYKDQDVQTLSSRLLTLYQMMEEGKITKPDEKKVELQMICCCLAIEDEIRRLILLKREEIAESTKQK